MLGRQLIVSLVACLTSLSGIFVGCGGDGDRTEILVAIDTDLDVPMMLDAVRVDMVGPGGQLRRSMGPLTGPESLPATVGMVHGGTGPLGPVQVTVVGSRGGMDFIQRRATVSFIEGETRVLWMLLVAECVDVRCTPDETCAPGGCRDVLVGPDELAPWTGSLDRLDGGPSGDASVDGCVPTDETCNGEDDDCDGTTDEGFALETDDANCGACGNACPSTPPNGSSNCVAGMCELTCDPNFADCDPMSPGCESLLSSAVTCGDCDTDCVSPMPLCEGDPTSGYACVASCGGGTTQCETVCTNLSTDPQNCGACGVRCIVGSHAAPACAGGTCGMSCDPNFADCDAARDTGCETSTVTLTNCGGCGALCELPSAMQSCATGTCTLVGCDMGFGDCDGDAATGCETDVASSTSNCGTCGTVCPAAPANSSATCTMGACGFRCDPGFGNCDMDATNGCETLLSTAATCGTCGISCAGSTPVCSGSAGMGFSCVESCAAPNELCGPVCTAVTTDPLNCGGCGTVCPDAPQASPACASGSCALACDPGFGDCNGAVGDGCEVSVTTLSNCGACGAACAPANATGVCASGTCAIASCAADWLDCDMDPTNGCETSRSSMNNCGACGAVCPASPPNTTGTSCMLGTCSLVCSTGFGNCNGVTADGCEAPLNTEADCGSCGSACALPNATSSCATGTCEVATCSVGFDDCDGSAANGCETNLSSSRGDCGTCGNDCGGGPVRCCSGVCTPGVSCP